MLIPKTRSQIYLNRLRIWMPPIFVVIGLASSKPALNFVGGLPLVLLGEALRIWAAGHIVKDESLTVSGPYAHLRNPLYLGSLISGLGFLLIMGDWGLAVVFLLVSTLIYLPTVKHEQDYLRLMHGEAAFETYRRAVPALLPRLTPASLPEEGFHRGRFTWARVLHNQEHRTWISLVLLCGLLVACHFRH